MFGTEVEKAAQAHALAEWPKESCGVVRNGVYVPIMNIAENPEDGFVMPDDTFIVGAEAVIHSHDATQIELPSGLKLPRHPHWPSSDDMAHQIETDVPWGIISTNGQEASTILWWGDHILDDPLVGRNFIPGITDCYGLIRAWYHQERGVELPDFPRDANWWEDGKNMFVEGFAEAGFKEIDASKVQHGDVVIMKLHGPVPCHGGVVLSGSLVLHHLENRLSRREPLGPWRKFVTNWLRYDPDSVSSR